MTHSPSGGWREVYQWCHVDVGSHDDLEEEELAISLAGS